MLCTGLSENPDIAFFKIKLPHSENQFFYKIVRETSMIDFSVTVDVPIQLEGTVNLRNFLLLPLQLVQLFCTPDLLFGTFQLYTM